MTPRMKSFRFIDRFTRGLCLQFLEGLDTPVSLGLYLCLKYSDDVAACTHEIDPLMYNDSEVFCRDYAAISLLSKYTEGPKGHDQARRDVALEKFWTCEDRLKKYSRQFQDLVNGNTVESDILYRAREKLRVILGPLKEAFYSDSWEFGPGSSSSIPRRKAHASNKLIASDVSAACAPFVTWFFQDINFPRPLLEIVEHSRIEFVPKSFKTDRVIAVEPDWNVFFQKGVGRAIRSRLRRFGLDLNTGAVKHQHLSREASLTGALSTIDLSSASDSIGTFLVRFLLPNDWFMFMNSIRTDRISIDGEVHPLRKFSSMGNGFTFELETLIFYAISLSCRDKSGMLGTVSVFGDDIVLPTGSVDILNSTLTNCGFVFNESKSFSTGYFRESCGAHFFNGRDCKPYYLKNVITDDSRKFHFCNSLHRLSYRLFHSHILDSRLYLSYTSCFRSIRRICYIPEGFGDGGLITAFDDIPPTCVRQKDRPVRRYPNCIEGYKVRCLQPVVKRSIIDHDGMYLHKLRRLSKRRDSSWHDQLLIWGLLVDDLKRTDETPVSTGNEVTFSLPITRYRLSHMFVPRWIDPGQI